jgi:hypothetical protein
VLIAGYAIVQAVTSGFLTPEPGITSRLAHIGSEVEKLVLLQILFSSALGFPIQFHANFAIS